MCLLYNNNNNIIIVIIIILNIITYTAISYNSITVFIFALIILHI